MNLSPSRLGSLKRSGGSELKNYDSRRLWRLRYDMVFGAILIGALVLRLVPLLRRGAPTGGDWANQLLIAHHFLGNSIGNQGLTYPPIEPLVLAALSNILPITIVTAWVGAASAVLPYAGIYLALRSIGPRLIWLIAPLPILISSSVSELMAFGGVPQQIADSAFPVVLVSAALLMDQPNKRRAVVFGLSIFILAGSSVEVFGQVVISLFLLAAIELVSSPRAFPQIAKRVLPFAAAALAPLLLLLPIYIPIVQQLGFGQTTKASAFYTPLNKWHYMTREAQSFWQICLLVSLLIVYCSFSQRTLRIRPYSRAATSVLITAVLFSVFVPNVRFSYLLPNAVIFALALVGFFVTELISSKSTLMLNSVIAALYLGNVLMQFVNATSLYSQQIQFYGTNTVTALDLKALDFIKIHTPPHSLFAVTSITTDLNPIGWWVEGYALRSALIEGNLSYLYYASQKRDSKIASEIFYTFPSNQSFRLARSFGVTYLVVFRGWYLYNAVATQSFENQHRELVAYSNPDVVIFRVSSSQM